MRRRVGGAEIIHGLHQSAPHHRLPQSVDNGPGEIGVAGIGQPTGQLPAPIDQVRPEEIFTGNSLAGPLKGPRMDYLA